MSGNQLTKRWIISALVISICAGCNQPTLNPASTEKDQQGLLPRVPEPSLEPQQSSQPEQRIDAGVQPWIDVADLPIQAWYSQYLGQKCIGVSQFAIKPPELRDTKLLRLIRRDVIEVRSSTGQPERKEILLESLERPNGQLLSFSEITATANANTQLTAELHADILTVKKTVDGKQVNSTVQWPSGAWGPLGTIALLRLYALQNAPTTDSLPSSKAQFYVAQLGKFVDFELKSGGSELTTLNGGVVEELQTVEVAITADGGIAKTKNWLSSTGEIMKSVSDNGFSMFLITEVEAERIESEMLLAVLMKTSLPVHATPASLRQPNITYHVEAADRDPFSLFSRKVNQRIKSLNARSAEITVLSTNANSDAPDGLPSDAANADCIQPSLFVPSDHPSIAALAKELGGSVTDPKELAIKLMQGLFANLKKETLSRKFELPSTTATVLAGDSVAHASLLVALLRNNGIPARVASGLRVVEANSQLNAEFHMWCEAWLGERWLPLDPFLGTIGVDADHLKFFESTLSGGNPYDAVLPVLQAMPQLTITIRRVNENSVGEIN
jgi:hypothetical protein